MTIFLIGFAIAFYVLSILTAYEVGKGNERRARLNALRHSPQSRHYEGGQHP